MENNKTYYKIATSGEATILPNGNLDTLQKAVGGYIEHIAVSRNCDVYVNEHGRINDLPYNFMASALVKDDVVGDVVVAINNKDTQTK